MGRVGGKGWGWNVVTEARDEGGEGEEDKVGESEWEEGGELLAVGDSTGVGKVGGGCRVGAGSSSVGGSMWARRRHTTHQLRV